MPWIWERQRGSVTVEHKEPFGCPPWLGGIEGSQGTAEEAASSSSWEGSWQHHVRRRERTDSPVSLPPTHSQDLKSVSLAVHPHEPKLLCFGRGECRKWKGDPRRPLAHPCRIACELFCWKWDNLFSMLNRVRSLVTSNWPCLRTCFKIWGTWGFWSRISCLQRKDYQREHEVGKKRWRGGKEEKKKDN